MSDEKVSLKFQDSDLAGNSGQHEETVCPNESSQVREGLITTAVNFLTNAKVRHTTLVQKQQFLKSKGLTNKEIELACQRAGVYTTDSTPTVINMDFKATRTHLAWPHHKISTLERIKQFFQSLTLLGGVAYAIYIFWKRFLEPFLFGARSKKKSIDDTINNLDKKVDGCIAEIKSDLMQVKETLARDQHDQTVQFMQEFKQFKSDLEAIKGLLLNRKQFAAPTALVGVPSIPAWQLSSSSPHNTRHHNNSQSDDNEKLLDDAGSGSGSSETEVVTKNSDSSLEMV